MIYVFLIIILIFSIIIHEIAHGAMAYHLGDPTAKLSGRLTLNPIKHLDPFGSVLLPLFLILISRLSGGGIVFGWAKPVPINPLNFRDKKYGEAKVALAGPGVNLLIALIFGLILRFVPALSQIQGLNFMFSYIIFLNILLAVFNLLPVPPLDGSHILFTFLSARAEGIKIFFTRYGFFILLFIIFFFLNWLFPLVSGIYELIVGSPLIL